MFNFPYIALSGLDQELAEYLIRKEIEFEKTGKRKIPENDKRFNDGVKNVTEGIRGEIAVARYLGIRWSREADVVNHISGDLEFGIEVKATGKSNGNLYCSRKTHMDYIRRSVNTPIACARVDAWPWVEIPGWLTASEIRKYPFQQTDTRHNQGFLANVDVLRTIEQLQEMINNHRNKN